MNPFSQRSITKAARRSWRETPPESTAGRWAAEVYPGPDHVRITQGLRVIVDDTAPLHHVGGGSMVNCLGVTPALNTTPTTETILPPPKDTNAQR